MRPLANKEVDIEDSCWVLQRNREYEEDRRGNRRRVVFLGSTCHSADVAAPLKNILEGIPEGSKLKLAGFVTHSTTMPEDGALQKEMYERWAGKCPVTFETVTKERRIEFIGYFHCQGAPSPQIEDFIRNNVPDVQQWDGYFEDVRKHPTPQDIEAAKTFARDTLAKY